MVLPEMARWAKLKGIDLLATADYTHPLWFRELQAGLEEAGEGIYRLKEAGEKGSDLEEGPHFLLSTELSCIYSQGGRGRRIHLLVLAPSMAAVEKLNRKLVQAGVKLTADGRPTLGMSAKEAAELIFGIDEDFFIIPCHVWTPWYSLYGSRSGFDSLEECFGELAGRIRAVETGLSSDPAMNWRIEELENRAIVSFSDAHSPEKFGREATIIEGELSYGGVVAAFKSAGNGREPGSGGQRPAGRVVGTIEFYPEEGKYHYTGHRDCGVRQNPEDTARLGRGCPVCGKPLTVGVMHRVEDLAARPTLEVNYRRSEMGVRWLQHPDKNRPPYVMLVPLQEVIAEAMERGVNTRGVKEVYFSLVKRVGSEFDVLLRADLADLGNVAGMRIVEGIRRVRAGELTIEPGYDGVFGKVKIFGEAEPMDVTETGGQLELF
jgi:uncharacterized protein (TIGR00375 family)